MPTEVGQIKGAPIVEFLRWYTSAYGRDALVGLLAGIELSPRVSLNLSYEHFGLLSSDWYPARAFHEVLDRVVARTPPERVAWLARESARAVIATTLKGIYRVLFSFMMSPARYAQNAQQLFGRYYRPGTFLKLPLGSRGHRTVIRDWPGHHPLLCEMIVYTGEYVYEAMGCRDVEMRRTGCISDGASECSFETTWSAA
jgi:hypothetical protein